MIGVHLLLKEYIYICPNSNRVGPASSFPDLFRRTSTGRFPAPSTDIMIHGDGHRGYRVYSNEPDLVEVNLLLEPYRATELRIPRRICPLDFQKKSDSLSRSLLRRCTRTTYYTIIYVWWVLLRHTTSFNIALIREKYNICFIYVFRCDGDWV